MFGNITELKDLALPTPDEIKKYKAEDSRPKKDREDLKYNSKDIDKLFAIIPVDPKERKYAYDVLEFNAIMESLSKVVTPETRRWQWWRDLKRNVVYAASAAASYAVIGVGTFLSVAADTAVKVFEYMTTLFKAYDSDYYRGREDSADQVNLEYEKMAKLERLMICWLIHTRYRVDLVIRQRKFILGWDTEAHRRQAGDAFFSSGKLVGFRNYRLGYLFNRLRRVKYMQAKAVHTAHIQRIAASKIKPAFNVVHDNYGWQLVRWYEKMIHLDQDLRDLCQLVIDTLDENIPDPKWNPRELELKMAAEAI